MWWGWPWARVGPQTPGPRSHPGAPWPAQGTWRCEMSRRPRPQAWSSLLPPQGALYTWAGESPTPARDVGNVAHMAGGGGGNHMGSGNINNNLRMHSSITIGWQSMSAATVDTAEANNTTTTSHQKRTHLCNPARVKPLNGCRGQALCGTRQQQGLGRHRGALDGPRLHPGQGRRGQQV